jgi:two-component system, cell cycle response regulator
MPTLATLPARAGEILPTIHAIMIEKPLQELALLDRLPTAPGVGIKLLQLVHQEGSTFRELVDVVTADPALSGRLLKRARPAVSDKSGEMGSVQRAIEALGEKASRTAIEDLSLATRSRIDLCAQFDYDRYWLRSLASALAARRIAERTHIGTPEQAYTLGLLSGIGRLALATLHPEEYANVLTGVGEDDAFRLTLAEREHFQIDHGELTATLFADWGLPDALGRAAQVYERRERTSDAEDPETLRWARLLRLAHALAGQCISETKDPEALALDGVFVSTCRALEIDLATIPTLLGDVQGEWRERAELVRLMGTHESEADLAKTAFRATTDAPAGAVSSSGAEARARASTSLRILAAGNDPTALRLVERMLREQGHSVRCVSDGSQALQAALEFEPQVVISDWNMPKLDGVEVCRALRRIQSCQQIFFLLLIARGEEDRVGTAFEAGIDDYVIKPFNPEILLARFHKGQSVLGLKERAHADMQQIRALKTRIGVLTRKLEASSATDALTGFPNRKAVFERLEDLWAHACADDKPLSVILIDIDRFQAINEQHGYRGGDQVLLQVAATLRENTRLGEDLARFGGGEFIVVCPNSIAAQAAVGAERMRTAVEVRLIRAGSTTGNFTVSIGVAQRSKSTADVDGLIRCAFEALRAAKRSGRNQVSAPDVEGRKSISA